jgi:hypothetical protein
MAIDTKTMGYIQLAGGLIALWSAWRMGFSTTAGMGLGALGLVFVVMGYHHVGAKGHRKF